MVAVGAFSNFVNIERSHSTSVNDVICSPIKLFQFLGLPNLIEQIMRVISQAMFFKQFHHIMTPPYHSQSNGAAERVIASFKHFISINGDMQFVEQNHNFMPLATKFYPPAKEVLAFEAKTHMPRHIPG